jgi:hypothetical protein
LISTIELSGSITALGFVAGKAAAGRVGASAKAQAANPINKSRFMFPPWTRVYRDEEEISLSSPGSMKVDASEFRAQSPTFVRQYER